MARTWRDIFGVDDEINTAVADTTRINLYTYVLNGTMTVDNAARNANITTDQFRQQMEEYNRTHSSQEQTAQTQTV